MMRLLFTTMLLLTALITGPAHAVRPDEMLADPKLEARARDVGQELRCLVCRNQSIDDSDADLAHDLRVLVRERIKAGDSNDQVIAYIRSRYGDQEGEKICSGNALRVLRQEWGRKRPRS